MDNKQHIDSERVEQFMDSANAFREDRAPTGETLINLLGCIPGVHTDKAREAVADSFQYFPNQHLAHARLASESGGIVEVMMLFDDPSVLRLLIDRQIEGKGTHLALDISTANNTKGAFLNGSIGSVGGKGATHGGVFLAFDGGGFWQLGDKQGQVNITKLCDILTTQQDLTTPLLASNAIEQASKSV